MMMTNKRYVVDVDDTTLFPINLINFRFLLDDERLIGKLLHILICHHCFFVLLFLYLVFSLFFFPACTIACYYFVNGRLAVIVAAAAVFILPHTIY